MSKPRAKPETAEERRERCRRIATLRFRTLDNPVGLDGHELITNGLDFTPLPASEVCPYPPGSIEKIEWMRRRVSRCEDIDHPDDCDSYESVAEVRRHPQAKYHGSPLGKVAEYIYHDPMTPGDEAVIDGD